MNRYQSGATLIVALVLLVIVTLLGAAGMRGTTLEMKMIASSRDRAMAFEAAESTLKEVEQALIANPPALATLPTIFTANCTNGFCFDGEYLATDPYKSCRIYRDEAADLTPFWARKGFWEDAGKHGVNANVRVTHDGENNALRTVDTRFMVEFMCFTLKEQGLKGTIDDKESGDDFLIYMPIYRITAIAAGLGGRSEVMAQTMVKVNLQ